MPPKRRIDPESFPDLPLPGSNRPPPTLENVAHMLAMTGITVRFNVIKKRVEVRWRDGRPASENDIVSLANLNGLANG